MKLGILYSGIFWQEHGFRELGAVHELVYIYEFEQGVLDKYDILIVPKGIHQGFLKENADDFHDFVRKGGVLIAFGEMDGNWLYETIWRHRVTGELVTIIEPTHPVMQGLNDSQFNEWNKTVHGYFEQIPRGATPLAIVDGQPEKTVAFVDTDSFEGVILAMTMDPEYHTYATVPFARQFLHNILHWARETSFHVRTKGLGASQKPGYEIFVQETRRQVNWRNILVEIGVGVAIAVVLYALFGIR